MSIQTSIFADMYRQYSFLLVLPLIFTFSLLFFLHYKKNAEKPQKRPTVNAVIGDESFLHVFGELPSEKIPERVRIKTHLQYVEGILRNRPTDHLSIQQKIKRFIHLDHLREYIQAEKFPHNDGHPDQRRPTFISKDGNICAVGYLIQRSLGKKIVERINEKYKYAYITNIDDPKFHQWVKDSGFTIRELAMIQPMYAITEEVERNRNHVDLSYGIGSSVLASANIMYHSNNPGNPWLFNDASSSHWFGLAAGAGSVLIGALNLDNNQSFTEPAGDGGICAGCFGHPLRKVTLTNNVRKGLSIANIGVGAITVLRAGYHLINGTGEQTTSTSATSLRVTQLQPYSLQSNEPLPALQLNVRF